MPTRRANGSSVRSWSAVGSPVSQSVMAASSRGVAPGESTDGRADGMEGVVVVPVKPASEGKTRLAGVLDPADRASLARAMALDTIEAAAATPGVARVLVVT